MAEAGDSSTERVSPWEQGSLLPEDAGVLPLQWVHPDHPTTKATRGAVTAARRRGEVTKPFPVPTSAKQGDRLMVLTQSCDLLKPSAELPQIEVARVFSTDNAATIALAQDFGSARFFRVNDTAEPEAVIVDYGLRALLDKGFLAALEPDNVLLDALSDERRQTLARWLGQRYARPAVPDEDYPVITEPVRNAWKKLLDEEPETAQRFNREYAEWRYRREEDGTLTVYILAPGDEPDEVTALEVVEFLTEALQGVYPGDVRVATDKRSYATFTKLDELTTEQISMEWASRDEMSDDAARPE
jgi:hypothetical protein